jgi:hypothetical protein
MIYKKSALFSLWLALAFSPVARAEEAPVNNPEINQSETTVEKNYKLEIKDKYINEKNYSASTAVSIDETKVKGLNLKVGSAVKANEAKITLHNIFGQVYFKGTMEPVLQVIKNRNRVK